MKILAPLLLSALGIAAPALAADPAPRPDQLAFRELYKELVETNTTLSSGSCTLAAERMASRSWDTQLKLVSDARDMDSATANLMQLPR